MRRVHDEQAPRCRGLPRVLTNGAEVGSIADEHWVNQARLGRDPREVSPRAQTTMSGSISPPSLYPEQRHMGGVVDCVPREWTHGLSIAGSRQNVLQTTVFYETT